MMKFTRPEIAILETSRSIKVNTPEIIGSVDCADGAVVTLADIFNNCGMGKYTADTAVGSLITKKIVEIIRPEGVSVFDLDPADVKFKLTVKGIQIIHAVAPSVWDTPDGGMADASFAAEYDRKHNPGEYEDRDAAGSRSRYDLGV